MVASDNCVAPADPAPTLVEVLRRRAIQEPCQLAYMFLSDGEIEAPGLTYSDLDVRARAIGAWLNSIGATGGRAILLYPAGLDFVTAFLGCLYGGVTAVPAYSLDPQGLDRTLLRLSPMIRDVMPVVAMTTAVSIRMIEKVIQDRSELGDIRWIATSAISDELATDWEYPAIDTETLALIHYTSGSTGAPKGVMVSHRNLLWRTIQEANVFCRGSVHLTWRPIAHSGGLNHGVIRPLISGALSIIMAPEAFLQKPVRWLQAISRYKVTASSGPNFAYELCAHRISSAERKSLDLTSWTTAFVVAEKINPGVLERFAAEFGPFGFRPEAFTPRYGLTESTGLISLSPQSRGLRVVRVERAALEQHNVIVDPPFNVPANSVVSTGKIVNESVVIVDPIKGASCPTDKVGEIWVSSKNAAQGYWNKPNETELTFKAFLSDTKQGPFLRTGDLGFAHDGELFVTGRLKDLIIIRGRKLYPQDLEITVQNCQKAFGPWPAVSFSIQSDTDERVIILQELEGGGVGELEGMIDAIRRAVFDEHEVLPYAVGLVPVGTIPRSASGKLQRHACRTAYVDGRLEVIRLSILEQEYPDYRKGPRFIPPRTPTEKTLESIWCSVLGLSKIGIYDNFVDLGGHSILATQCLSRVRDTFGVELSPITLFADTANVRELAEIIDRLRACKENGEDKDQQDDVPAAEQEPSE